MLPNGWIWIANTYVRLCTFCTSKHEVIQAIILNNANDEWGAIQINRKRKMNEIENEIKRNKNKKFTMRRSLFQNQTKPNRKQKNISNSNTNKPYRRTNNIQNMWIVNTFGSGIGINIAALAHSYLVPLSLIIFILL